MNLMSECLKSCARVRRIFLAYNANIDAILHVSALQKSAATKSLRPALAKELSFPRELLSGISYAMENGEGIEIGMSNKVENWLEESIRPEKKRMGGQTGIMANHLSLLGIHPIVYAPLLSQEQKSLFRKNVSFISKKTSKDTKTNWIFEFNKGDRLGIAVAKQSSRFIASSRREDFRIKPLDLDFRFDAAILSGFQSVKIKYKDGSTYKDQFKIGIDAAKKIKELGKNLHYEMSYTPDRKINKGLIDLASLSDSIGMDEEDLINALKTLGKSALAKKLHKTHDIKYILQGMLFLSDRCDAKIHLHGRGYYLAACRGYHLDPGHIKKSMEFASVVATTYAQQIVNSKNDMSRGLSVVPSSEGIKKKIEIAHLLGARQSETDSGIFKNGGYDIICVPYRATKRLVDIVGLGDIISSSIFACETGFSLKNQP